jgi:MFS family permease
MPLNSTMIAVAVPSIGGEFDTSSTTVTQALVATYLVAAIALQSPGGKLGDRLGHWRVINLGQALLAAGALLGFVAPDLAVLALSRVLMAAGGAVVVPATLALLRLELPGERRGRAFGAFGAVMSLSAAIGPIIGGLLVDAFGWRSVFVVNLPVIAASLLVAATSTRRHAAAVAAPAPFDWVGSVLLTGALAALVAGLQITGPAAVPAVLLGIALIVPFVWWERRARDPVVAFSLFRTGRFAAGTSVVGLLNLVMYALLFEIPLLVHTLFRLDSEATGRLLLFMSVAMVVASLPAGRLVDAYGARPIGVIGTAVCLAGVAVLFARTPSGAGDLRLPLVLIGLGVGLANPAGQHASMAAVPGERSGMAAGVGSSMRYLGGIAGVAVLGRVLDLGGSRAQVLDTHRAVAGIYLGVLLVTLVCAAGLGARESRSVEPVTLVSRRWARHTRQ